MSDEEAQDTRSVVMGRRLRRRGDEADATPEPAYRSSVPHSATMPVHRNSPTYNMNHKYRGMAIIFNHEHFNNEHLNSRTGTNVDRDNLYKVLEGLGFTVKVRNDWTSDKILQFLEEISKMVHTEFDCLLIAVLTHGEEGRLYAKDTHYRPDFLWHYFTGDKCPTLAGKPKLFFIQACQGDKSAGHHPRKSCTEADGSPSPAYKIPVHADILIVYSTVPGYLSWRNTNRGSWFVQALCEEFRRGTDGDRHILTLLTSVCQRVALDLDSNTPDLPMDLKKKVPCITSMLTRQLKFDKK